MSKAQLKDYYLTIGLADKDLYKQIIEKQDAITLVQDVVKDSTIYECFGSYTHQNGTVVRENSLRVEVYQKTKADVVGMCEVLKVKLNQESIAVKPDGKPAFFV